MGDYRNKKIMEVLTKHSAIEYAKKLIVLFVFIILAVISFLILLAKSGMSLPYVLAFCFSWLLLGVLSFAFTSVLIAFFIQYDKEKEKETKEKV